MASVIHNKLNSKGFTLVEILVVILIIGVLFVAFLPKIDFAGDKARETGVKADLRSYMVGSEQLLKENTGFVDNTIASNIAELNKSLDEANNFADTGFSVLNDPWKSPYVVEFAKTSTSTESKIFFKSYGKSGLIDKPDFVMLTQYADGRVMTCTAGLNTNIGEEFSNVKKAVVGPPASPLVDLTVANSYKTMNCFAGTLKGTSSAVVWTP